MILGSQNLSISLNFGVILKAESDGQIVTGCQNMMGFVFFEVLFQIGVLGCFLLVKFCLGLVIGFCL